MPAQNRHLAAAATPAPDPGVLLHHPLDIATLAAHSLIPYGKLQDGTTAALQLSGAIPPHTLITGPAGSGVTTTTRVAAIEAARQGMDVRACDPRGTDLVGLRDWPNVTLALDVPSIMSMIDGIHAEMLRRRDDLQAGRARTEDLRHILFLTGHLALLTMALTMASNPAPGGGTRYPPAVAKFEELAAATRAACISLIVAAHPFHVSLLDARQLGNFGNRIALGRQSPEALNAIFGSAARGRQAPAGNFGTGLTQTAQGVTGVRIGWLPDPAHWGDPDRLTGQHRALLLSMLPAGSPWPPGIAPLGGTTSQRKCHRAGYPGGAATGTDT